jgi:SAM-dependent methyltransferase
MKKCLTCGMIFPTSDRFCPSCKWSPVLRDGFLAYAPALAKEGDGFRSSYFAELADMEEGYFWFRARNRLIVWAVGKYCAGLHSFLEIGCGTGFVLYGISSAYPEVQLHGSEIFTTGLAFAVSRVPSVNLMQMDARQIPFVEEFDAIGAFDVVEHIEQDEEVLMQMRGALKQGGIMLLTVPQHAWLWSHTDEIACHVRRYSADELHRKVKSAGFEILRSTSFVTSLLPAMLLSRFMKKSSTEGAGASVETRISPVLNRIFEMFMDVEIAMIRIGINFPMGGSRLIVARKI